MCVFVLWSAGLCCVPSKSVRLPSGGSDLRIAFLLSKLAL